MKLFYKYVVILILFLFLGAKAEERSSYEGTHFLIGFMQNEIEISNTGIVLQIFITSSYSAEVTVRVPRKTEQVYRINAKQVFHLDMPSYVENRQSEVNEPIAVEIISDVPITVYAFNSQYTTSDSYAAIPVNQWGKEYVVISMPNDQYKTIYDDPDIDSTNLIPRSSEFMVMAAYDNTTIEFQPKAITREGKQTFIKYNQTLNKGDCYLVQSYPFTKGYGDLTGTIVRSDKPIGVLSGHVRTAIPQNESPENSKDHLCEMLMPTNSWGKEFVSVPFGTDPDGDLFKLTAIYDNTYIEYMNPYGIHTIVLDAPGVSASVWDAFEPTVWRSNKPVQIGQFMRHRFGIDNDRNYDPCLVILPPVEQFVNRIIFQTVGNSPYNPKQFDAHYIYVAAEQKAIPTLMLDGVYVKDSNPMIQVQNVPGSQYNWAVIKIDDGVHEIYCLDGKFSGVMYGVGYADSYGMTLGSSLNNPYQNDSIPPALAVTEKCGRINGKVTETIDSINSGISFLYVDKDLTFNYQWQIEPYTDTSSTVSFTAQPTDPISAGQFVINIYDKNNNKTEYKYFYKGLDIELPNNIDFGIVNTNDSLCITVPVKNNSADTIRIDSISGLKDKRLYIKTNLPFPYSLLPGDSIFFDICFKPDTNISKLTDNLLIAFECERFKYIPLNGTAESPNLAGAGYDFGKVRIGDTVCAEVYIINKGNLPVLLNSLNSMQFSQVFSFDTLSVFPVNLQPGDSLKIEVCFTPDSLMNYQTIQTATNDRLIPNSIIVTGIGAAPQVKSVVVDWGGKRIQTKNDTSFYLINTGNYKCNVKFGSIVNSSVSFDASAFLLINNNLDPGDSVAINSSFEPFDTLKYQMNGQLIVDWKKHGPVDVEFRGEGTLPQISTIDVVFDSTKLYSKRDTIAAVVKSFGNEKLTIDSARFFSGDSSSFLVDYSIFRNLVINPLKNDTLFSIPIQFKPQKTGLLEMIVELTNDALPAYGRKKSYFRISGPSGPVDTIKADVKCDLTGKFYPCKIDTTNIIISNVGNVDLILQSLNLQTENLDAGFADSLILPKTIEPDSILKIPIYVNTHKNETGKIKITSFFNDSIKMESEFSVAPEQNIISMKDFDNLGVEPGDTIHLEINGKFENPVEIPTDFEIKLSTKQKNLFLIRENFDILLLNSKGVSKYKANVLQDSDKVIIRSEEKILIDETSDWSVKLKFYVLLGDEKDYTVNVLAVAEPCYERDSTDFGVSLKNICVFPLRRITTEPNSVEEAEVLPNPVSDDINLTIKMGKDDWINITVYDKTGKKCLETENLFLKKGIHSRIFEFSPFANGIYFLKVRNSEMVKNIMFIKYCY